MSADAASKCISCQTAYGLRIRRTVAAEIGEKVQHALEMVQMVHLGWGTQHLIARCAALEPLATGEEVYISVEPRHVVVLGA